MAEFGTFRTRAAALLFETKGRIVGCTDLRRMDVLPPDVFEQLAGMLRADNPKVERNAFLVSANSVVQLQMQRMIHETNNPGRRTFRVEADARAWLEDVLTVPEQARLAAFIDTAL